MCISEDLIYYTFITIQFQRVIDFLCDLFLDLHFIFKCMAKFLRIWGIFQLFFYWTNQLINCRMFQKHDLNELNSVQFVEVSLMTCHMLCFGKCSLWTQRVSILLLLSRVFCKCQIRLRLLFGSSTLLIPVVLGGSSGILTMIPSYF